MELHPKDANLTVVRDDYSLAMASCTQGRGLGQGNYCKVHPAFQYLGYGLYCMFYPSREITLVVSLLSNKIVEGEENIVQNEKSVNMISQFKKLSLRFYSTQFQKYF